MVEQLQMIWAGKQGVKTPELRIPEGYLLRGFRDGDQEEYINLMHNAGFDTWNRDNLDVVLKNTMRDGIIFAEHRASIRLVATAMGWFKPTDAFPDGYEMGWVAVDPAHRRKGLGELVVTVITRILLLHGARCIYLLTDDWRLPAIKIYLKLGYVPFYRGPEMKIRWKDVFAKLNLNMDEFPVVDFSRDDKNMPPNQTPGVISFSTRKTDPS